MSPRTGRPTDSPKKIKFQIRVDEEFMEELDSCAEDLAVTRSEVIRKGVRLVRTSLKKEKE